jgi:predicted pyridoxine 5'-phosphate oxidase superfamily flavin-nucleotide-binding protein
MAYPYLDIASTPSVRAAQAANGAAEMWTHFDGERPSDRFTPNEAAFIATRDTFYLASVSESGWPYVQHRGGPSGFLKVLDETTLGFVDYPHRARLKIMGHMRAHDLGQEPELAARLALGDYKGRVERGFTIRLEAFDWNCAQHITPRYTNGEIQAASAPLLTRMAELEAENAALREQLATSGEARP